MFAPFSGTRTDRADPNARFRHGGCGCDQKLSWSAVASEARHRFVCGRQRAQRGGGRFTFISRQDPKTQRSPCSALGSLGLGVRLSDERLTTQTGERLFEVFAAISGGAALPLVPLRKSGVALRLPPHSRAAHSHANPHRTTGLKGRNIIAQGKGAAPRPPPWERRHSCRRGRNGVKKEWGPARV